MRRRIEHIPNRRAVIDRRALLDSLRGLDGDAPAVKREATALLRGALDAGRDEIARRLTQYPSRGLDAAAAYAFLTDQIVRLVFDLATLQLYPIHNRTASERISLIAVGGYGRGEMALHSDVDIMFVTPWKQTPWGEQVIESILYLLWDLGLRVGHSSRSLDDVIRMAKSDLTIRTALLEARFVWGDEALFDEVTARYQRDIVSGQAKAFVADKLAEREARHRRMGDSRYVVEPNLKEGKGGLRDLHTLFWIGKFAYRVSDVPDLVDKGLMTPDELRQFQKAENFLWAVRCHLHRIAGRPEERLTFDVQPELARVMRYADRPGQSGVERFMRHYFLTARQVGDLTGLFLAHLDETFAKRGRRFGLIQITRRPRHLAGFTFNRGRLGVPSDDFFREDPVRLIELFHLADLHGLDIHPLAMRQASRDASLIDPRVRADPRANQLFLDILTSPRDPEPVLRWMNEAGVFGRFIPDFGRVVAQMQFDMYHHYTVDEHSIRAIGLLSRIEKGEMAEDHPQVTAIMRQIISRRTLYVAVLLHDIAKGRGGDHSILGAEVAEQLCPRLGMTPAETETVAWLVRHHLLMSATAFRRDLADFKTILDFVEVVQSPERLRLLLALTVVDIRAVGPGVWNGWKRQLLADLYNAAEEVLRLGHKQKGRNERIAAKQEMLAQRLGWGEDRIAVLKQRFTDSYWLAEPLEVLEQNARQIAATDAAPDGKEAGGLSIATAVDPQRAATLVSVYAGDHPGLFYRIAGAISLAGGNIIDARIHTTRDGMALDNFLVQDAFGDSLDEPERLARLKATIEDALANRVKLAERLKQRPLPRTRAEAFRVEANVLVDNSASNRYTVVEVNALDRPALLNALTYALFQSKVTIHSAHIATYGERAVDVFYLTDLTGDKITDRNRLRALEKRLLEAAAPLEEQVAA